LNLKKHKPILEDIEHNELVERREATIGKRTVTIYRPTQKGMAFCRDILEPYEKMFPRRKEEMKKVENFAVENEEEKKKANKTDSIMLLVLIYCFLFSHFIGCKRDGFYLASLADRAQKCLAIL
jgi:hypothetical protein